MKLFQVKIFKLIPRQVKTREKEKNMELFMKIGRREWIYKDGKLKRVDKKE